MLDVGGHKFLGLPKLLLLASQVLLGKFPLLGEQVGKPRLRAAVDAFEYVAAVRERIDAESLRLNLNKSALIRRMTAFIYRGSGPFSVPSCTCTTAPNKRRNH